MVRSMLSEPRAVISRPVEKDRRRPRRRHEIMIGTPAIRNLIREGKIAQMYSASRPGSPRHADPRPVPDGVDEQGPHYQGRSTLQSPEQRCALTQRIGTENSRMDRDQAIKLMQDLLRRVTEKKASDLFITAGFPPAIKIDGEIRPQSERALTPEQSATMVRAIMNDRQPRNSTHESATSPLRRPHRAVPCQRIRSTGRRRLCHPPDHAKIPSFEELDLPPILQGSRAVKARPRDSRGRYRSGKSTSAAAMVGYRNEKTRATIVTIEDPIEYVHQHKGCVITHREVGVDTDSWHTALKNTLRQAPDVILIGISLTPTKTGKKRGKKGEREKKKKGRKEKMPIRMTSRRLSQACSQSGMPRVVSPPTSTVRDDTTPCADGRTRSDLRSSRLAAVFSFAVATIAASDVDLPERYRPRESRGRRFDSTTSLRMGAGRVLRNSESWR